MTDQDTTTTSGHRLALALEYDGSAFNGWQRQKSPEIPTVQAVLESALSQVANEPVKTICAGRTDSGVHATCQVVHFEAEIDRGEKAWTRGVNSLLPGSVRVIWAKPVSEDFHARFSATGRRYVYLMHLTKTASALHAGKLTSVFHAVDVAAMNQGASYLLGERDFSSFRAAGCQSRSPNREVFSAEIRTQGELCYLDIHANAFLQHMVRNIMGTLLEVGRREKPPQWVAELLAAKDRTQAGVAAAPDGLYLMQVDYPQEFALPGTSRLPLILGPQ